jgi:succinyl-CoA:acetate CoA-transferase
LQHEVNGPPAARVAAAAVGRWQYRQRRAGGLNNGPFDHLTAYTEVLQDGMLDMLESGKLDGSTTSLALSPAAMERWSISTITASASCCARRRYQPPRADPPHGLISMNALIEADMYGNVNSTHVMGSSIMNGIGGSGDFARNAYLSIFMTPIHGQGRQDQLHRAHGLPCRSHRA